MSVGIKFGNFTIIFLVVQVAQVDESMVAINMPFMIPFLNPSI